MKFLTNKLFHHHDLNRMHGGWFHGHRSSKMLFVDDLKCTRCGNCIKVCHQNVFAKVSDGKEFHVEVRNLENCTRCRECFAACKFNAISLIRKV